MKIKKNSLTIFFLINLFLIFLSQLEASPIEKAKPWEIKTPFGETILPDIFYAEDFQNEQLSPLMLENNSYQINRLIYPTIGNPNLFERYEENDLLYIILRLEPSLVDLIYPEKRAETSEYYEGTNLFSLKNSFPKESQVHFYLIKRNAREETNTIDSLFLNDTANEQPTSIYEINASKVVMHDRSIVPEPFNKRDTLRYLFNKNDLKKIPDGLYDLRIEIMIQGMMIGFEYQYNAVRIFDQKNKNDYSFISIADTQISTDNFGGTLSIGYQSASKVEELIHFINTTKNPKIKNAPFIILNGDLHNGGSTKILSPSAVFSNLNNEANLIIDILKNSNYPTFLVPGNHDGIVSFGHAPSLLNKIFTNIGEVIKEKRPNSFPKFIDFINATRNAIGGKHVDIFNGQFIRKPNENTFNKAWLRVPEEKRNLVMYDGFYQWQKAYGPLYYSFKFGNNFFLEINTFELRQHKRSGWGMYLINFGGGISPVQTEWIKNELQTSQRLNYDTIISSHHDPRGGHEGKDFPYYYKQLDYTDISSVVWRFFNLGVLNRLTCNTRWIRFFPQQYKNCHHDGLHEWMHPDPEFDCADEDKYSEGSNVGKCFPMEQLLKRKGLNYSGHQLINLLSNFTVARTFLIGHLHYATMEMLQHNHELIPPKLNLTREDENIYFTLERANPVREAAYFKETLESKAIFPFNELNYINSFYEKSSKSINRFLQNHELAILRLTSASQTTPQARLGRDNYGLTLLNVSLKNDLRNFKIPQVNKISYFQNIDNNFTLIGDFPLDRTKELNRFDDNNPLNSFFTYNETMIY